MAWIDAIGQHGIQRQEFLFVGQGATGADIKAEEAVGAALRHIQRLAVGRDLPLFQHLGLDLVVGVGGQQGVVDHVAVPRRDVRGSGVRIGQPQWRVHDGLDDGFGVSAVSHHQRCTGQRGRSDKLEHGDSP
ncbi:hypothetical protein G6F59_015460 [Rhizopus arrhizus]|nr:hypothetical protein G6F59_015460 [Rhizopus arrhizus]